MKFMCYREQTDIGHCTFLYIKARFILYGTRKYVSFFFLSTEQCGNAFVKYIQSSMKNTDFNNRVKCFQVSTSENLYLKAWF